MLKLIQASYEKLHTPEGMAVLSLGTKQRISQ